MDETQNGGGWDAWAQAITGNAINAAVDRVFHRPQYGSDVGVQYGMDGNGQLYQLGQPNGQVTASVQTRAPATILGIPAWLVVAGVVLYVVMESK
jgi:hypothetical protein